jgi:hypothetical protein
MNFNPLGMLLLLMVMLEMPMLVGAASCSNNWQGGSCTGTVIYNAGTTLINNVNVTGNVVINGGTSVLSNGYAIYLSGTLTLNGVINTGQGIIGWGGPAQQIYYTVGNQGNDIVTSYGASGAGGRASGNFYHGGQGGTTQGVGNGGTPGTGSGGAGYNGINANSAVSMTLSNSNINTWFLNGFINYLTGAGGGSGGAGQTSYGSAGGNGASGIYLQANVIDMSGGGVINAYGSNSLGCSGTNEGGGGGGGIVILAYNSLLNLGTINDYGGNSGGCSLGEYGGNGNVLSYRYISQPIPTIPIYGFASVYSSNSLAQQGWTELITTNVGGGVPPYSYNIVVSNVISGNVIFKAIVSNALASNSVGFTLPTDGNVFGTLLISSNVVTASGQNALGYNSIIVNPTIPMITCSVGGVTVIGSGTYNTLASNTPITCSIDSLGNQVTTGNLFFNGAARASGNYLTSNKLWDDAVTTVIANTLSQSGYSANSMTFSVNCSPYSISIQSSPSAVGYETQTQLFTYGINYTKAASVVATSFFFDGNLVSTNALSVTNGVQSLPFSYALPLFTSNNLQHSFTVSAKLNFTGAFSSFNPIALGTMNTFKQTELWNYIPATLSQKSTILAGDSDNIFMNITQPVALNLAFVNISTLQVGTSNSAYSSLFAYKYYRQLVGFTPSSYGYSGNTPIAIGVNSFLQLYFNGQNVWRNTSNPTAFTVVTANLTTCNPTYPTKSYYFTFWNASTGLQYTQNVQLNGNLRVNNGATIPGNTAGMPLTTNGFQYWTCQQPSWASFYVNATLNYSTSPAITLNANTVPSVTASYYLLNLPTSNVIKSIPLYLSYVTNPSTFNFEVQALNGSLISAIVEVSQYNVNNGNSVVVNDVKTPTGGGTTINLQTNAKYQFFVYSLNGQFLANTTVQTMYCLSGTVCNYVIPVGAGGITGLQQFTSNLNYGCTQTALAGNNERVQCTITSVNRTSIYGQLQVFKQGMVFNNMTCNQTASSMTVTLTCISSKTNNTSYHWILSANLGQYGITEIKFGDFGYSTGTSYGSVGWLFLIMLVMVSSLAFVKIPVLGMIGALLAVLVASFVGGIALTLGTIGCLILFFGLGIWVLGKGNT